MSSSLSHGNVSAQWDVGKTAFSSADCLLQLIRTVAQDNVQPQAVLAAESLGFGLIVSSKRIDEAIVALGGNESTRIAGLKVMIGLTSGGIVRIIRNSTALTQFFLVATACKLCYTSEEIGMLMFEMIAASGLLNKYAVASAQLSQLVYSFSGHAEAIVPVDLMHEVAVSINKVSPDVCTYRPLEHTVLAELLFKVFGCLQDETVESVTLSGSSNGIWLTTFFLWLLPEVSSVFVQQQLIKGTGNGRLSIELRNDGSGKTPWAMQIWRSEGPPTAFVFSASEEPSTVKSTIPIQLTKAYMEGTTFSGMPLQETARSTDISAIGELAGALICLLTEEGRLCTPRICCDDKPTMSRCAVTSFKNAMSSHWMSQYEGILADYGWDDTIKNGQHEALAVLRSGLSNRHLVDCTDDVIWQRVLRFCQKHIDKRTVGQLFRAHFVVMAIEIAIDAIATATCNFLSGHRRHNPSYGYEQSGIREALIALLSSKGLSVYDYRRLALSRLFAGSSSHENDLVVAVDGLVAGWDMLWHMSTRQIDVLSIRICVGHIRRDDFAYRSIREVPIPRFPNIRSAPMETLVLSEQSLLPKRETCLFRLHTVTAPNISHLDLKSSLVYRPDTSDKEASRRVSWSRSIAQLVTACHIDDGYDLSTLHPSQLVEQLRDQSLVARWTSMLSRDYIHNIEVKYILKTFRNEELRFFAAAGGMLANRYSHSLCSTLVVRHSASLLSCIVFAEEMGLPYWTIIC